MQTCGEGIVKLFRFQKVFQPSDEGTASNVISAVNEPGSLEALENEILPGAGPWQPKTADVCALAPGGTARHEYRRRAAW